MFVCLGWTCFEFLFVWLVGFDFALLVRRKSRKALVTRRALAGDRGR